MKFVHVGDLHLGRWIHQYSLLDIQKGLLDELLEFMDEQDIRLLVIAGDVYDRLIPSQEAVNVLDAFLEKALLHYGIEVMMISGNHDSSDRLHFASSLLHQAGLYIETYIQEQLPFYQKEDVRFYLLPFVKPSHINNLFDTHFDNYQDALAYYLDKQVIDHQYKNVLVTHQFVGHNAQVSDSELPISLGGSEIIKASLFDEFDYVALGHLHAPQYVSQETIRYSGSLMAYSFDEVKQRKSITIVDTDDWSVNEYHLHPLHQLRTYKGSFEAFLQEDMIEDEDDLLSLELTNEHVIPHAMEQLKDRYPHLLQLTYSFVKRQKSSLEKQTMIDIQKTHPTELFKQFYYDVKQQELSTKQQEIMEKLLEKVGVGNENS